VSHGPDDFTAAPSAVVGSLPFARQIVPSINYLLHDVDLEAAPV
jgi:hypothetical protein